jgi:transcriptional regulator with XRE-family HTH domain
MKNLQKLFGERVRYYRLAKGLSQERFAEQIELSRQTVSQIETGRRWVSAKNIERMVNALNINYVDLFNFNNTIIDDDILKSLLLQEAEDVNDETISYLIDSLKIYKRHHNNRKK